MATVFVYQDSLQISYSFLTMVYSLYQHYVGNC